MSKAAHLAANLAFSKAYAVGMQPVKGQGSISWGTRRNVLEQLNEEVRQIEQNERGGAYKG